MRFSSAVGLVALLLAAACASEADRQVAAAKEAAEQGDLDSALELIALAIEADPGDGANHRRQGEWLLEQGDMEQALAAFDRAAAAADPSHSSHRKAVAVALDLGDLEGAESRLIIARQALSDGESQRDLDELEQVLTTMRAEAPTTADSTETPLTETPASPESASSGVAFINWSVVNVNNIQEFRVHRADSAEGPFTQIATIEPQGSGVNGNNQYSFEERGLEIGRVVHYKIEHINRDGSTLDVGPVRYVVEAEEL